ncbi:MAG: Oar protein [Lysobacteraceae bacterium]|nr:MAG: Oar protein [Xanthomonadaceae bacterium]
MASNYLAKSLKRSVLAVALGLTFAGGVQAQTNTSGAVSGRAASGDTIAITNPATGFSRTITASTDGSYRFSSLPTGQYQVSRNGGAPRTVTVNVGTSSNLDFVVAGGGDATTLDTVTVVGTGAVNPIDVSSVESTTILTEAQIDRLPVQRNTTAVALLAPGTVRGDSRFGNLASFGGASVAENVYYINGFNVTNIVTGTAFSQLPFEALSEQQVKTGGYGAEFGRSLGGVVNMITKRGTNDWKFGANVIWSPDSLNDGTRFAYDPQRDGTYTVERGAKTDSLVYNLYGGGPLIKDRLFLFALYQGEKIQTDDRYESGSSSAERKSPQGLIKLDWNITDNHLVEFTAFRDRREEHTQLYQRTPGDLAIGGGTPLGTLDTTNGGDNYILRWTGYLTDSFTLSALYGRGEYSRGSEDSNSLSCPIVQDGRTTATVGPLGVQGCWVTGLVGIPDAGDVRKSWRVDGEWSLGDHIIRFGLDREEFATHDGSSYSGNGRWNYANTTPGSVLTNDAIVPAGVTEMVRFRQFNNGGDFLTKNSAWYIEDTWQVTDNFILYGGIRNEAFQNYNSLGGVFIDVKDTWAPRFGFSWDVKGDSSMKVYGNIGRYYIPVYANTNVRLAGSESDYFEWYTFTSIDPVTGIPGGLTEVGERHVTSSGGVPDPRTVVDNNISPLFQDEMILGFQVQLNEKWSLGVRGIRRDLKSGMDDICPYDEPFNWALENGYTEEEAGAIGAAVNHCFLTNPGKDLSMNVDLDGSGNLTTVVIPADALGLPLAKRKYHALEVFFERSWDDKWFLQGSYTFAKSIGNTEGYVKSDNGQDDAGITQDFDYPGLMDGAYGYLPNDRRHSLKLFGAYQITDEFRVGANLLVQSGRPHNCFGVYPADGPDTGAPGYGAASFYCGTNVADAFPNTLHPRGTSGRVPWARTLDLNLTYEPRWAKGLLLGMNVNNVLDSSDYYRVQDVYEDDSREPLSTYLHPRGFVAPRSVQFTVQYEFGVK